MNENKIPELDPSKIPEFLQGDNWFSEDVSGDFLDFEEPYRPPRYTLERNGVPFADVGELHIISGKPGHGKTGLMSQLMAAILCGQHGNTLRRNVPHYVSNPDTGERIEQNIPNVLLYVDTEQGKDDTIAIKNRVCSLAGIDYTKPCPYFYILRLRDTETPQQRWRKILKAIYIVNPTDIFLDGMLDIVNDYNDQMECQPIIRKCMILATRYDASLWAVLHENPLVDKLVGTLGSITQRKVSEIFTTVKVKQSELKPADRRQDLPPIYFRVKQVKARGRDVDDWLFEYITNAGGWGMPVELNDTGQQFTDPYARKIYQERKEADGYFRLYPWTPSGTTYSALERFLRSLGISSNRKIGDLFNTAMEANIICKGNNKKYYYNGFNKELPNDNMENLPFDRPESDDEKMPF